MSCSGRRLKLWLVSDLRIAAPFAASSHGNPETKGQEQIPCARVAFTAKSPFGMIEPLNFALAMPSFRHGR
jgi:hypothetical protein